MTNEYISKQDALKGQKTGTFANGIRLVAEPCVPVDYIESLEPADVVPVVHAHWRDTGSGQECSACKEIQYGYDTGRHYCPNCGAKMDREE